MERSMVLLVQPPLHPTEREEYDNFVFCETDEECRSRWDEFERLQKVMESLGFKKPDEYRGGLVAQLEGCNWEGWTRVDRWTISDVNIKLLENRAEELKQIREQALKKLSTEEQIALGLLKQV